MDEKPSALQLEIQQRQPFRSRAHEAVVGLLRTTDVLRRYFEKKLAPYGITMQQYNVLRILRGQHPGHASVNLIRDRMLDKMSDASRIVERLRLKQLVSRKGAEKDKRAVEVTITETGLQLLREMEKPVEEFEALLKNLTDDETRQLNTLLDKIRDHASVASSAKSEAALH